MALTTMAYMVEAEEALRLVIEASPRLEPERVPLEQAAGLRLAEDIRADRDYPPFDRAMMDGYAVRLADAGGEVNVIGEVAAGSVVEQPVQDGACFEIMTGAPCPPGAQAVVQLEHVRRNRIAGQIVLPRAISRGLNIAPAGSECRAGAVVARHGEKITELAIAAMASFGTQSVMAHPRPSLAVITTGAEFAAPGKDLQPAKIRDSNGPMLNAMARTMGLAELLRFHVRDRFDDVLKALGQVDQMNIVVLTGGVSAGKYDLVPDALERWGAELVFHKVKQKPGKPLLFARRGRQLIFGLPGNPLSCHLCFHRYVTAAVRAMQGEPPEPRDLTGVLAEPVKPKGGRAYFLLGRARPNPGSLPHWRIHPVAGKSSADVFTTHQANCYVHVPPASATLPVGREVPFEWIGASSWVT